MTRRLKEFLGDTTRKRRILALDLSLIDEYQTVSDRDAFAMARRLTREEGLFVGGSSGLIAHVALSVARRAFEA